MSFDPVLRQQWIDLLQHTYTHREFEPEVVERLIALIPHADPEFVMGGDDVDVKAIHVTALHAPLLQAMVNQGFALPVDPQNNGGQTLQMWLSGNWRKEMIVRDFAQSLSSSHRPDAWQQEVIQQFVDSLAVIHRYNPQCLAEGNKDVHGRRHLSFLHHLMWTAPVDETGAMVIGQLVDAGIPVCDDLIVDSQYLKDKKPLIVAEVERAMMLKEVGDAPKAPGRRM